MLAAMVSAAGGDPWVLPIARDTAKSLDAALARAASADLLLITGGVSAGKFDLVEPALVRAGARFHFTGVRIQPGKPLVFGELHRRRPAQFRPKQEPHEVLPDLWASRQSCLLRRHVPALRRADCRRACRPQRTAVLASPSRASPKDVKTKTGLTRFLPAACTFAGAIPQVALVPWQGSGDLAAMARANCFLVVPEEADRLRAGSTVRILLP